MRPSHPLHHWILLADIDALRRVLGVLKRLKRRIHTQIKNTPFDVSRETLNAHFILHPHETGKGRHCEQLQH